jgi:hypothetical protein
MVQITVTMNRIKTITINRSNTFSIQVPSDFALIKAKENISTISIKNADIKFASRLIIVPENFLQL